MSNKGRPTKYNDAIADKIIGYVRAGCNRNDSAQACGIAVETMCQWMRRYPDFMQRVHEADAQAAVKMELVVSKHAVDDPKIAIAWLQAKRQKEWGKRQETQISNADGKPFETVIQIIGGDNDSP